MLPSGKFSGNDMRGPLLLLITFMHDLFPL